jgi:hypothetical protein
MPDRFLVRRLEAIERAVLGLERGGALVAPVRAADPNPGREPPNHVQEAEVQAEDAEPQVPARTLEGDLLLFQAFCEGRTFMVDRTPLEFAAYIRAVRQKVEVEFLEHHPAEVSLFYQRAAELWDDVSREQRWDRSRGLTTSWAFYRHSATVTGTPPTIFDGRRFPLLAWTVTEWPNESARAAFSCLRLLGVTVSVYGAYRLWRTSGSCLRQLPMFEALERFVVQLLSYRNSS